jgi:hypothetical protein
MTEARYHELLGRMLDSRISQADAEELRRGVETDPARIRDLREHLTLWELWDQELSPDRGADAFRRRFEARLMTEISRPDVVVTAALPSQAPGRRRFSRLVYLACAAGVILALTVGLLRITGPASSDAVDRRPAPARLVSLRGEAVCTRCILHQTKACQLALRVHESGREELWDVNDQGALSNLGRAYCSGATTVLAQGSLRSEHGRQLLLATRLEVQH